MGVAVILLVTGLALPIFAATDSPETAAGFTAPPMPPGQTGVVTATLPPVPPEVYWTEERMRSAQPYPMELLNPPAGIRQPDLAPQAEGEPGWAPSLPPENATWTVISNNPPLTVSPPGFSPTLNFTTTYLEQQVSDRTMFPYGATGKVYFTMGGRNYVCSAAVIGENAIWTAGHCVNNGRGQFHSNWAYIPAFVNYSSPYISPWVAVYAIAPTQFANLDMRYDYAVAIVTPPSYAAGRTIRQTTGALGFAWNMPREQPWVALGYPTVTFGGLFPVISYGAYAEVDTTKGAPYPFGMGSAMKAGASGGPWLLNMAAGQVGEANYLGGVNSYINLYADELYTPYLGDLAKQLWDCAQASTLEQLDCGAAPMTGAALTDLRSSDGVAPGARFTYTLGVHNYGTLTATNLTLVDTLPAGVTLADATLPGGACAATGSVVTCTLSTLAPDVSVTATLAVTAPEQSGLLVNTALIRVDPTGAFATNYYPTTASVTTAIQEADLVLAKAAHPAAVAPGAALTYTLTITNNGPLDAVNVVLTDTLPPDVTFDTAALPGGDCAEADGVVVCTLDTLAVGESVAATLVVTTPEDVIQLSNTASVTADQSDVVPDNNLNIGVETLVEQVHMALTLSAGGAVVQAGAPLTYWVAIENRGPLAATGVELENNLPPGATFVHAALPGGACEETDGVVGCTLDTLAAGDSVTATVTALAPLQSGVVTNTAVIYFNEYDVSWEDDSASLGVRVDACWARLNDDATNYYPLQAAIDTAQPGDLVKVAGTCVGVTQRVLNGILENQTAYITQSLTLRGGYTITDWTTSDPVAHPTTLDALGQGRALVIAGAGVSVTVEGLRFTGGHAFQGGGGLVRQASVAFHDTLFTGNNSGEGGAGGLGLIQSRQATLSHNTFSDNATFRHGGGLALFGCSDVTVSDNLFDANNPRRLDSNRAAHKGGGLYIAQSDQVVVRHNTFTRNKVYNNAGGGLGLLNNRDIGMSGNTFISNTAPTGGGLAIGPNMFFLTNMPGVSNGGNPNLVINGNLFISNTANIDGGGLYISDSPTATISNNRILRNQAGYNGGGLLLNASPNATFINTLVAQNTFTPTVSDLYIRDSSACLLHTTLAGSGVGQGLYVINSTVALTNTILDAYETGLLADTGGVAAVDSVLWSNTALNYTGAGMATPINEYTGDPAFADPAGDDYHLTENSAAINLGVEAGALTDLDGTRRDSLPDLGAYEFYIEKNVYLPLVIRQE